MVAANAQHGKFLQWESTITVFRASAPVDFVAAAPVRAPSGKTTSKPHSLPAQPSECSVCQQGEIFTSRRARRSLSAEFRTAGPRRTSRKPPTFTRSQTSLFDESTDCSSASPDEDAYHAPLATRRSESRRHRKHSQPSSSMTSSSKSSASSSSSLSTMPGGFFSDAKVSFSSSSSSSSSLPAMRSYNGGLRSALANHPKKFRTTTLAAHAKHKKVSFSKNALVLFFKRDEAPIDLWQ